MKKFLIVSLLSLSFSFLFSSLSHATLIVAATIGGQNFCATDNNVVCTFGTQLTDTDGNAGRIDLAPATLGGILLVGSAQQATFGPSQNILNVSFLQATNTTGATITGSVTVSATGFIPPVSRAFTSGSATFTNAVGSTTSLGWYNDPANTQGADFALDRPGILIDSFTYNTVNIADSYSHNGGPISVSDPNVFSMTLATDFTLVAGGQVTNRGMTELKPIDTVVPEPTTLALFGTGLLLAGRKKFFTRG